MTDAFQKEGVSLVTSLSQKGQEGPGTAGTTLGKGCNE